MFFYIVLFGLVSLFSFLYSYSKEKIIVFLSKSITFFMLFIPAAIRKDIGTDYFSYMRMFIDTREYGFNYWKVEYGYYLLIKILQYCFNYQSIFIVMAFFTFYFLFKSLNSRKEAIYIIPLFFLLYYTASYNIVRHIFVLTVFLYGYKLFINGKIMKAYIVVCISCLFHYSAVLFVIYLLLCRLFRVSYKKSIIYFLIILVSCYAINIGKIIIELAKFTPYGKYIDTGFNRLTERRTGIGVLLYLLISVVLLIGIKSKTRNASNLRIGLIIYVFFWGGANQIMILIRLRIMYMVIFLPAIVELKKQDGKGIVQNVRLYIYICFQLALLLFVFQLLIGQNAVIPYKSIFN